MERSTEWLNKNDEYGEAVAHSALAFVKSMGADESVQAIEREASYDAGFVAGVLATEAGVGRADG
jgi:hypothetical protein